MQNLGYTYGGIEAWLSLVERRVRDAEAASSNLVASIPFQISYLYYGSLVKGLRRRPLTAKTWVRFPYELLKRLGQEILSESFAVSCRSNSFFCHVCAVTNLSRTYH